jgi:hypothetical protein
LNRLAISRPAAANESLNAAQRFDAGLELHFVGSPPPAKYCYMSIWKWRRSLPGVDFYSGDVDTLGASMSIREFDWRIK